MKGRAGALAFAQASLSIDPVSDLQYVQALTNGLDKFQPIKDPDDQVKRNFTRQLGCTMNAKEDTLLPHKQILGRNQSINKTWIENRQKQSTTTKVSKNEARLP